jgi:hypothetical protein
MNNNDTEQTHGFYTKDLMILKFKHMEIVMTLCTCIGILWYQNFKMRCTDFQVVPTDSTMSIFYSIN